MIFLSVFILLQNVSYSATNYFWIIKALCFMTLNSWGFSWQKDSQIICASLPWLLCYCTGTILNNFKNCDRGERYRFESSKLILKHIVEIQQELKQNTFSICMISRCDYKVKHSISIQCLKWVLKAHKEIDPFNWNSSHAIV